MNKKNNTRQRKVSGFKNKVDDTNTVSAKKRGNVEDTSTTLRAVQSHNHKLWTRIVVIFCVLILIYFFMRKEKNLKFATQKEHVSSRFQKIACSESYLADLKDFHKCVPKTCGRFVTDSLIENKEIDMLLNIAQKGFSLGGSSGGASILDLHSGALSKGEHFVDIYSLPESRNIFKKEHLNTYRTIKSKIKHVIAEKFQVDENTVYPTIPTFFSKITNVTAKTLHDEYWHSHVDKETYESFHYTSLLYLADFGKDFTGGRFLFIESDKTNKTVSIEPKRGRLSVFTSGAENVHYVEKVTSGTRYAITISFTCNPKFASNDSNMLFDNYNF